MSTNFSVPDPTPQLVKVAESAKKASILLGQSTNEQRCEALTEMANALNVNADEILKAKGKSWQISSLFLKPDAYKGNRKIDFVGFEIPNHFIVVCMTHINSKRIISLGSSLKFLPLCARGSSHATSPAGL